MTYSDIAATSRAATMAAHERGAGTASQAAGAGTVAATNDMFLKLLVAQIRNQDPLNPQDPSQYVSQLVQLAQLSKQEEGVAINKLNLDQLTNTLITTLGAQVGSRISVHADEIETDAAKLNGGFVLKRAVSDVKVVLTGEDGAEHVIELGPRDAGRVAVDIDPSNPALKPGRYSVSVRAEPAQEVPFEVEGVLTEVALVDGAIKAHVAGVGEVGLEKIVRFRGRVDASPVPAGRHAARAFSSDANRNHQVLS
ncbi:flagellar hook capping FlgD N-terminal domain-containing protein [Chitinasiproducens palmae]|uniref:Basal-body rod modification protein FlgD n=1 Tax=Chitinasiproducens palmae TaxID=1770053 RepID=A0A1H2PKJ0_9BURK|nr:flagellar hook capping FlgD N-terminal domain-containing protein [Chitinasiproducens palmae]SDV46950.1 flagellar basal-body rod modification protein FlgD [Chitinasiproducens palmae]